MADSKDQQAQAQPVVVQVPAQAPGPTDGMLQPKDAAKDPNAKPTYMVDGVEVDPDGNPVKDKDKK